MMAQLMRDVYKPALWEIYARAISLVTIIVIVAAFVLGGRDLMKLAFPAFTLNASLHEKYQTNESYTEFGAFKKELSQAQIMRERTQNYQKLLRMERRGAIQDLTRVGLALLSVAMLNMILIRFSRHRQRHPPDRDRRH
jgi:hypothetical protein